MPKKKEDDSEFTKASIKKDTKEVLKSITKDKGVYEYELIDKLLRDNYPSYFRETKKIMI
jgi:hypothetical protein